MDSNHRDGATAHNNCSYNCNQTRISYLYKHSHYSYINTTRNMLPGFCPLRLLLSQ